MKSPPSGGALPIDVRALAVLLTLLVLLAALLLATLLLAWLLLAAALLLTALLLLAGFLVRILIHGSFLFKYWFEAPFRSLTSHGKSQTAEVAFVPTTHGSNMSGNLKRACRVPFLQRGEPTMGRYLLLWLLGVPIPILLLIWLFGGLH